MDKKESILFDETLIKNAFNCLKNNPLNFL